MKVQVMTIQTVQKSSKSELSSRGKGPFKVFVILRFWLFFCRHRYGEKFSTHRSQAQILRNSHSSVHSFVRPFVRSFVEKSKTLNGRLPLEDSSDFDDSVCVLIVTARSIVWDTLWIFRFSGVRPSVRSFARSFVRSSVRTSVRPFVWNLRNGIFLRN